MTRRGFNVGVPRSYAAIERTVRNMRAFLAPRLHPSDPLPGVPLFEQLDEMSITIDGRDIQLDYHVEELPTGIDGETRHDKALDTFIVTLSETTYVGLVRGDGRARFSFAHELAHAFLHPNTLLEFSKLPHSEAVALRRAERTHKMYLDSEWQADATASALLMPADGLEHLTSTHGTLTPQFVSTHFGVSGRAAEIRLETFLERRDELTII